jgi:hypothetical protein
MMRLRWQKGQSAFETVMAIPVMLLLFLIGFQLFAITWNAQYAHVTSRYTVLNQNSHYYACSFVNNDGKIQQITKLTATASAPVTADPSLLPGSADSTIQQKATIVCGNVQ